MRASFFGRNLHGDDNSMRDLIKLNVTESIVGVVAVSLAFLSILVVMVLLENVYLFFSKDASEIDQGQE